MWKTGFLRQKEWAISRKQTHEKESLPEFYLKKKKWFNLVFPVSILPSYIRNRSFQRQLQYIVKFPLWAVSNFSSHFSCALYLSSSIHGNLTCYQKAHFLIQLPLHLQKFIYISTAAILVSDNKNLNLMSVNLTSYQHRCLKLNRSMHQGSE